MDEVSWMGPLAAAMGEDFGFTLDTPIAEYSPEAYHALLYGSPKKYHVHRFFGKEEHEQFTAFEGVVNTVERRMKMNGVLGEGYEDFVEDVPCPRCRGRRLSDHILAVTVGGLNIDEITRLSVARMLEFVNTLTLTPTEATIAEEILKEIRARLGFLCNVGLHYLTLARKAGTLSGGEAQRIRLATQIGSSLVGVMYILDEPSIGLHQRDNGKLIKTLADLRDLGNRL